MTGYGYGYMPSTKEPKEVMETIKKIQEGDVWLHFTKLGAEIGIKDRDDLIYFTDKMLHEYKTRFGSE